MSYELEYDEFEERLVEVYVKESPDCGTCGDSRTVVLDANDEVVDDFSPYEPQEPIREDGCPSCNPSPEVLARQLATLGPLTREREPGNPYFDDEAPF